MLSAVRVNVRMVRFIGPAAIEAHSAESALRVS
jgi:hypothetical protein